MEPQDRRVSLRHPAYWPVWVAVFAFRLLCKLPWSVQAKLGKAAGRFFHHVIRYRRHIVAINLELCFPEMPEEERREIALRHYEAMGIGVFETGTAWWAPPHRLPSYRIEGREHLEEAIARGKGVLLLTAHFTTLEICGRLLSDQIPMGGLFREPNNPVIAKLMHRGRIDKLTPAIPMDDLRGLLRALKAGHIIWYAPDQGKRTKLSAILPFFGVPARTNTATSRIASMTGAAVVPYFGRRLPDGTYLLTISPALENFPTDDSDEDATRINRLIEEEILQAPEQYFWIHRRFKKRGPAHPYPYNRKRGKRKKAEKA